MTTTFIGADEAITHRVASPHAPGRNGPRVLRNRGWQPGWELSAWDVPAGGVLSCARDLSTWARAWLDGGPFLGAELVAEALRERVPFGGFADGVGLGWLRRRVGDVDLWGHRGETIGYETELVMAPGKRFAFVGLTNGTSGAHANRAAARAALEACLGLDDAPPAVVGPGDVDLADFVGAFLLPFDRREVAIAPDRPGHLRLTGHAYANDGACWYPPPGPSLLAGFRGPDRLVVVEPPAHAGEQLEFGRGGDGRVAWLRANGRAGPRTGP
jgi:hypothetical protein